MEKTDNELIAEFYCNQLNLKGAGLKDNHWYFGNVPVAYSHKSALKFDTSWDWAHACSGED